MQKRVVGLVLVVSLLVLSSVIVSAFSFSELWNDFLGKKTVTGNVVSDSDLISDLNPKGNPFTLSAWINTNDVNFIQSVYSRWSYVGAGTADPRGFEFAINYPDPQTISIWDGPPHGWLTPIPSGINEAGKDYHLAITREGTTMIIYVNGVKKGTLSVNSEFPDASSVSPRIGRSHYDLSNDPVLARPFQGIIKNSKGEAGKVDIYNRALSEDEVKELYAGPSSNKPSVCVEDWECLKWTDCTGGVRARICKDNSKCGTINDKPAITETCTVECVESNWVSTISPSSCPQSGQQTKTWTKSGTCSGGVSHPLSETISCIYGQTNVVVSKCVATTAKDYYLPSAVMMTDSSGTNTISGYCEGNYYNQVYCADEQGKPTLSGVKYSVDKHLCEDKCISNSEGKEGACYKANANYNTCTDSDGGDEPEIVGKITGVEYISGKAVPFEKEDSCTSDGKHLTEYICNEFGATSNGNTYTHTCDYGCDKGKCNEKSTNSVPEKAECTPKIECQIDPSVCPASGKQMNVCGDVNNCVVDGIPPQEIKCTPGLCSGCKVNDECISYGTRQESSGKSSYCDVDGSFKEQKGNDGLKCQNNYECLSNLCSSGKCTEREDVIKEVNALKAVLVKLICQLSKLIDGIDTAKCLTEYGIK